MERALYTTRYNATCTNCGNPVKDSYVLCWSCNEKSKNVAKFTTNCLKCNKSINSSYKLCWSCNQKSKPECTLCNDSGCSYWSDDIYGECMNCDAYNKRTETAKKQIRYMNS